VVGVVVSSFYFVPDEGRPRIKTYTRYIRIYIYIHTHTHTHIYIYMPLWGKEDFVGVVGLKGGRRVTRFVTLSEDGLAFAHRQRALPPLSWWAFQRGDLLLRKSRMRQKIGLKAPERCTSNIATVAPTRLQY